MSSYAKWIIAALVFGALWLFIGLYFAFVVLLISLAVLIDLDSKIPYTLALVLLLMSAFIEALSYPSAAKWLAAIAFYGMAMGIVLQFSAYVKDGGNLEDEPPGKLH